MATNLRRLKTHKDAKKTINRIYDNYKQCLIIHYSCESFNNNKDGKTHRITSIAIKNLNSAQIKSFSLHKISELKSIPITQIEQHYDSLEKEMLKDFYRFVKDHRRDNWIHWNMRDINYGFEAIEFRAKILGIKSCEIKDENKYDLSKLLIDKYGEEYSLHPRLTNILKMNQMYPKNWLDGETEAEAFNNKEFIKLHQSTLCKVNIFENILKLSAEERFKNKSKFYNIYGIGPQAIFEMAKDYWWCSLLLYIITLLLSAYLGRLTAE